MKKWKPPPSGTRSTSAVLRIDRQILKPKTDAKPRSSLHVQDNRHETLNGMLPDEARDYISEQADEWQEYLLEHRNDEEEEPPQPLEDIDPETLSDEERQRYLLRRFGADPHKDDDEQADENQET